MTLVLHVSGDGTDGQTTILDESGRGHTLTRNGTNIQISSGGGFVGGRTSLRITPAGTTAIADFLTSDTHSDFNLDGDFTIEAFVRATAQPRTNMSWLSRFGADNTSGGLQINRNTGGGGFFEPVAHDGSFRGLATEDGLYLDEWVHTAIDRSGSTIRAYVNGRPSQNALTVSASLLGGALEIGRGNTAGDNCSWNGYLRDIKVWKGEARYNNTRFWPWDAYVARTDALEAHAYWRIACVANQGGANTAATEIEWAATPGGADQATGGTAIGSAVAFGFVVGNAFDDDTGTFWAGSGTRPWIGYQFAAPVAVRQLRVRAHSTLQENLKTFWVQYSDDGITWIPAWLIENEPAWSTNETREYVNPIEPPPTVGHPWMLAG